MNKVKVIDGRVDDRHAFPRVCRRFFLDSGAHSLYTEHVIRKKHLFGFKWYETPAFWKYVDRYAAFLKQHKDSVDWYANVDVIFEPRLTWKVQRYLELEHGLNPVPVVHFNTSLSWIDKYLERGYKLLGVGGLGQEATRDAYINWADRLYAHLCSGKDRLPVVRTHGFAMTSYRLMIRYPWWSVDSASWAKCAAFGGIFVPHKRDGRYTFEVEPYVVGFSHESNFAKIKGKHINTLPPMAKKIVYGWLEEIGVPIGTVGGTGKVKSEGVSNHYGTRAIANMRFYQRLCESLPNWPWPFTIVPRKGFFP